MVRPIQLQGAAWIPCMRIGCSALPEADSTPVPLIVRPGPEAKVMSTPGSRDSVLPSTVSAVVTS